MWRRFQHGPTSNAEDKLICTLQKHKLLRHMMIKDTVILFYADRIEHGIEPWRYAYGNRLPKYMLMEIVEKIEEAINGK